MSINRKYLFKSRVNVFYIFFLLLETLRPQGPVQQRKVGKLQEV